MQMSWPSSSTRRMASRYAARLVTVYGSSLGFGSSGECSVSGAVLASKKVVVLSCTTRVAPTVAAASSTCRCPPR